ncbi:MarR family winged helix-turn-helix transcriptional regulator [Bordetella petrii]|nr:MarR family transcriptional regulator [Bordetella petrii]
MAKQSMGYLVDSLLEVGYLDAAQSVTDRRAKLVRLSNKGMQMQSRAIEIGLAIEAEWARCMGEVEMGALRALLKVLAESIPETNGAGDLPAQSPLTNTSTKKEIA